MIGLWMSWSAAHAEEPLLEEPPPDEVPQDALLEPPQDEAPEPFVSDEITVWGERVRAAREAVISEITGLGYTRNVRERDGRLVFIHEDGWKGKVVLYDDGRIATRRTGPSGREMEPLKGTRIRPYFLCLIQPTACVRAGAWAVSDRRWMQIEDKVARETSEELVILGDRMADEAVARVLVELPDKLDALWQQGRPLEGETLLVDPAARRDAVLRYWDSRTETLWGQRVREVVAAFVRGEIQRSEHPYTEAEIVAFEAQRRSSLPFPW